MFNMINSGNYPLYLFIQEILSEREILKERVQELEERLGDWMAENDTLQSSANL